MLSLPTLAQQAGPKPGNPPTITAEEWQELGAARAAAIKANPDLVAENTKLMARIRDLEAKINAAMVKTDPSIAPLLAKYQADRESSGGKASPAAAAVPTPSAGNPVSH